jgi:hypothetical protein
MACFSAVELALGCLGHCTIDAAEAVVCDSLFRYVYAPSHVAIALAMQ